MENPLAVRKFLQDRSDSTKNWNYPKADEVSTEPGGISTNWATFYHDVKIPGFKQKLHLPVISSLTRNINGLEVCPTIGQCVLKVNENELGCLIFSGVDGMTREKILENRFLDGEILKY